MASSIFLERPTCRMHHSTAAQVLCRDHKHFLCTECLIENKHAGCSLRQLRDMTSKADAVLLDFLVLEHLGCRKMYNWFMLRDRIEIEKNNVASHMEFALNKIEKRLEVMLKKEAECMADDIGRAASLSTVLSETITLENTRELLTSNIRELLELEKTASTHRSVRNDDGAKSPRRIKGVDFEVFIESKRQAKEILTHMKDETRRPVAHLELAGALKDICTGRRKIFGKSSLDVKPVAIGPN